MKEREKKIITNLIVNQKIDFNTLIHELNISRRTLYYDIDRINKYLEGIGKISIRKKEITISGKLNKIQEIVQEKSSVDYDQFLEYETRRSYILEKMFNGFKVKTSSLASEMYISNSTIKDTVKRMKSELNEKHINIIYNKGYKLIGCEGAIRELFLETYYDNRRKLNISTLVGKFDESKALELTDYSMNTLTAFTDFMQRRIQKGYLLEDIDKYRQAEDFYFYEAIPYLFEDEIPKNEQIYMSAFVSSLSNLNTSVPKKEIEELVDKLIDSIERKLMIFFKNKEECKSNMLRHIASSYYRIMFSFPINNPLLEEIRYQFRSLFNITKKLFNTGNLSDELRGIRDEEIAYIVSYLGSYIFKEDVIDKSKNRVLIACPNGITISKTIQFQIERHFPQLEVIDTIPVSRIGKYSKEFDYLISTIDVEGIDNTIVVNPILRNFDLDTISRVIFDRERRLKELKIEDLFEGINKYSEVHDEENLRKFLYNMIHGTNIKQGGSRMLKEILTLNRIKFSQSSKNWMEAIKEASQPLLEEGKITQEYVDAMIQSVKDNGPYIVLDDYFALAHARPNQGVNELSMSMLKIDNAVDFLGEDVKVIVVLAATDNKRHLQALASLTELLSHSENLSKIISTDSKEIVMNLINEYS